MKAKNFTKKNMQLTLIGAILLSGLISGCSKNPAELQKKFMAEGQRYFSEGKTNESIIEFQNLLKVNPRSAKGRYWLGKAYLKRGWTAEAVQQFQEASKEDPLLLGVHLELARYGVNSSQWTAVKPEIAAILKIDPNNADGWTYSGQRALALGRENEAIDDLHHALSLNPQSVGTLVAMGDLKFRQKHPNKAKALYQKALSKNAKDSNAWIGLGYIAQSLGQIDEAQNDFEKAVQVDPSDLRSKIILSNSMAQQGHVHKAIRSLKAIPAKAADLRITVKIAEYETLIGENIKAIRLLHPIERQKIQIPDIYFVLAKAYQQSGQRREALDMVDRLMRIGGIPSIMKIAAARIELSEGQPDSAQKILDSMKGLPNLPIVYYQTKGQVELGLNHSSQAIRTLNEALKTFSDNPVLLFSLVDAQIGKKNYRGGMVILSELLKKDPQNIASISRMGVLLGRTQGARAEISYYHDMARKYPKNPATETLYILSLATNKKLPHAINEDKAYLATHPNNPELQFLLSQFYSQTGHNNRAIEIYKTILGKNPKNLQVLVALANQDFANKHYAEAESLYRRAILLSPENANLYASLGQTLLVENQTDEASKDFQIALSYNPDQPTALLAVAKIELRSGQSQKALTHLALLMKVPFPSQGKAQIQWLWGLASESNGNMKSAQDSFEKAVKLDPKNPAYHASLGDFWASLSQWDKSLPEYEKSLNLHSDNPLLSIKKDWVIVQRGKGKPDTTFIKKVVAQALLYRKSHPEDTTTGLIAAQGNLLLQKPSEAQTIYDSVLSKNSDNQTALIGKSTILLGQGHVNQAKKIIDQLLTSHPDNIQANLMLASIDQKANNIQGEVNHLEKIHQLHPDWVQPALALSSADLALKRYEEAKSVSFALHVSHPDLSAALYFQASAEMGLKEYRGAMRDYQSLIKNAKNPGPIYSLMSVAALQSGDSKAEKHYLDLAFKNSPNDPVILNNMAFYLANNSKDLKTALVYAKKAMKMNPQPFIQDTVGYILFRMGNYSEAEPHFKTAYEANFRDPEFLFHMGMNEWKLEKNDLASDHLRKSIVSGSLSPEELEQAHKILRKLSAGA